MVQCRFWEEFYSYSNQACVNAPDCESNICLYEQLNAANGIVHTLRTCYTKSNSYQFDDGVTMNNLNQCVTRTTRQGQYYVALCTNEDYCNVDCRTEPPQPTLPPNPVLPVPLGSVTCYDCSTSDGTDCQTNTCQGAYCLYQRRLIGNRMELKKSCLIEPIIVLDDDTAVRNVDICEVRNTVNSRYYVKICNDLNFCNNYCSPGQSPPVLQKQAQVTCYDCDGSSDCFTGSCQGNYCIYEKQRRLSTGNTFYRKSCSTLSYAEYPDNTITRTVNQCEQKFINDVEYQVKMCNNGPNCNAVCSNSIPGQQQVTCTQCSATGQDDCNGDTCLGNYCVFFRERSMIDPAKWNVKKSCSPVAYVDYPDNSKYSDFGHCQYRLNEVSSRKTRRVANRKDTKVMQQVRLNPHTKDDEKIQRKLKEIKLEEPDELPEPRIRRSQTAASRNVPSKASPKMISVVSSKSNGIETVRRSSLGRKFSLETPTTSAPNPEEDDGVKTRRVQKTKESIPRCALCKNGSDEELYACTNCKAHYHLTGCLKYPQKFAESIRQCSNWKCARCIRCKKCEDIIADPSNVECWSCCKAWHGNCAPKGVRLTSEYDGEFICQYCHKKKSSDFPKSHVNRKRKMVGLIDIKPEPTFQDDFIEITLTPEEIALMAERNKKWDRAVDIVRISSPSKASPMKKTPNARHGGYVSPRKENSSVRKNLGVKQEYGTPRFSKDSLSTEFDLNLYHQSVQAAQSHNSEQELNLPSNTQWVYMGTGKAFKAICSSAYPEDVQNASMIYVCKFCLHSTHRQDQYRMHWENCDWRFPPGTEIYRDGNLAFFEVDGAKQKTYCRNLCLLAKLFISSKTLHYEVETFLFYILCEITTEGYVMVGYFSKEKNPSKNNNLSCLLTLPSGQKMGYGRYLIDMSYALSRLELRIGSPEHPLSDLGILAYRGYWRSSILCYLRSLRHTNHVTIKDISLSTRIHPVDVVNQMLKDRLLTCRNGNYYVKTGKRALKHPLSQLRRRTVDMSKLTWKPDPASLSGLDPTRINHYV
ncbi:unnamed protein product [Caenorhabditis bovis]|uniref:Histone acetyltransferase n=1 Tax=Caenorhabditis bovis TaxID=2654633 RepID=A0A8S1F343_9PELO|nr:unnamed protein product [Caenorhabditis bovis]